jgi:hypothetical protein
VAVGRRVRNEIWQTHPVGSRRYDEDVHPDRTAAVLIVAARWKEEWIQGSQYDDSPYAKPHKKKREVTSENAQMQSLRTRPVLNGLLDCLTLVTAAPPAIVR